MFQLVKDDTRRRKDCAAPSGTRRAALRIRFGDAMYVSWLPVLLVGLASTFGGVALAQNGGDGDFSAVVLNLSGRTVSPPSGVVRADAWRHA